VPRADVLRRFTRGWENFQHGYRPLADERTVRCTSIQGHRRNYWVAMKKPIPPKTAESFAAGVGRGLRLAARSARKTARAYGTPLYVWENGKVVAKKP
jgi:hypothetical protein